MLWRFTARHVCVCMYACMHVCTWYYKLYITGIAPDDHVDTDRQGFVPSEKKKRK